MNGSLTALSNELPDGDADAEFTKRDLLVVLQGLAGIVAAGTISDPLTVASITFRVLGNFATQCNTGTLQENKDKLLKWLTFGKNYAALQDSSELDFTQLDVEAVPEIMKVNYHMSSKMITISCKSFLAILDLCDKVVVSNFSHDEGVNPTRDPA